MSISILSCVEMNVIQNHIARFPKQKLAVKVLQNKENE